MVALPWLELDSQTAQLLRVEPPSFAATVHPAGRQDGMVRSWKIGLRLGGTVNPVPKTKHIGC